MHGRIAIRRDTPDDQLPWRGAGPSNDRIDNDSEVIGSLANEQATADFAARIEARLAELRGLAETAAPVMSPLDPNFDSQDKIEIPEDDALTLTNVPESYIPDFDKLSKSRMVLLVRQQWLALRQAEKALAPNMERYRRMFHDCIYDKPTAIQATRAISPGLIRTLPLSLQQMNDLLNSLTDRVKKYGVPVPANWSTPVENIKDEENGDYED